MYLFKREELGRAFSFQAGALGLASLGVVFTGSVMLAIVALLMLVSTALVALPALGQAYSARSSTGDSFPDHVPDDLLGRP